MQGNESRDSVCEETIVQVAEFTLRFRDQVSRDRIGTKVFKIDGDDPDVEWMDATEFDTEGAAFEKPKRDGGCRSCRKGKPKIYRWLGMRWLGKPWPLRWQYSPKSGGIIHIGDLGCGCIIKLKAAMEGFSKGWKHWRAA